jgi:hypothetical protein
MFQQHPRRVRQPFYLLGAQLFRKVFDGLLQCGVRAAAFQYVKNVIA